VSEVGWVANKDGALIALVTSWKCVIVHLKSIAATEKTNVTVVAMGLLKKLERFQVCIYDTFLCR
jgi:hypothetical protein